MLAARVGLDNAVQVAERHSERRACFHYLFFIKSKCKALLFSLIHTDYKLGEAFYCDLMLQGQKGEDLILSELVEEGGIF